MSKTKEFFDNYAEEWDSVNRYNKPPEVFRQMVALLGLKHGAKVVDLGCGTGILIPYLLEAVGNDGIIYAVDISHKMLARLSQKFTADNIKPFAVQAEGLSGIKDTVDALICFSTFPHIEDKKLALFEMSKILKPGGKLLISHFSSRNEINAFHATLPEPICRHVLPDDTTMKELFAEAGFIILSFIDEPSRYELLAERKNYV